MSAKVDGWLSSEQPLNFQRSSSLSNSSVSSAGRSDWNGWHMVCILSSLRCSRLTVIRNWAFRRSSTFRSLSESSDVRWSRNWWDKVVWNRVPRCILAITWWTVSHLVNSVPLGEQWPTWWTVSHLVNSDPLGEQWPTWWTVSHLVNSVPLCEQCPTWWTVSHLVNSDPLGEQCSTWWTVSHFVNSVLLGEQCPTWWTVSYLVNSVLLGEQCPTWWTVSHLVVSTLILSLLSAVYGQTHVCKEGRKLYTPYFKIPSSNLTMEINRARTGMTFYRFTLWKLYWQIRFDILF